MSERRLAYALRALGNAHVAESTGVVNGQRVDMPATCPKCGKVLMGYAARPWQTKCRGCKEEVRRH